MGPLLQPARLGTLSFHARLVANEPEKSKVSVHFAFHHRIDVELDVRLARETPVVAQDAKLEAVRDEPPEMCFRTVQEFLDQAVRARARSARDAAGSAVEIDPTADE